MKPEDEATMIAERSFQRIINKLRRLKQFSDVKLADKGTGKITREQHQALQSATARRTRDKILEGKLAVDLLASILEEGRGLIVQKKEYIPRGGVILGTIQTIKTAISVASVTKLKYVPAGVKRLAKQTSKDLPKWMIREYGKIYAALVYFDVESPIFDILLFELVFD